MARHFTYPGVYVEEVPSGLRAPTGAGTAGGDPKYVSARRLSLHIQEWLIRSTDWAVFEPNGPLLWAQLRHHICAFLEDLWRQGALHGSRPDEAYVVKCDEETTTEEDILHGVVNCEVRFAPLQPAEFVVLLFQRKVGPGSSRALRPAGHANTHRLDPYTNFKFRVQWDGRTVAGFSEVSGLKRTTEPEAQREGAKNRSLHEGPGNTKYDAITLERGVTHDPEFEHWANEVFAYGREEDEGAALRDLRRDVLIELYDERGQRVLALKVFRCWVSALQVAPDLNAKGKGVAIEILRLEHEGWERARD